MWECINDPTGLERMRQTAVLNWVADRVCKKGINDDGMDLFTDTSPIKHATAIIVDTTGRILHRMRKEGDFTKQWTGGGRCGKSAPMCHYAVREGVLDEAGIGFMNPAVVDVSAPIIMVEPKHESDWKDPALFSVVWYQFILVDEEMIEFLPDEPILNASWNQKRKEQVPPTNSTGQWGHWKIGGERLRCRELERDKKGNADKWSSGVAYCWESILPDTRTNGRLGWNNKKKFYIDEYRPYEWNALELLRDTLYEWVQQYNGERRVQKATLEFHPDLQEEWKLKWEEMENLTEPLRTMVNIMQESPEVRTSPWPDLPLDVLRCLRSREWMTKLVNWPRQSTIDGKAQRCDIGRIGVLLQHLQEFHEEDPVLYAPLNSTDLDRTTYYRKQAEACKKEQLHAIKQNRNQKNVPAFDEGRASGNPGAWNFVQPIQRVGIKRQEFTPQLTHGVPDIRDLVHFLNLRMTYDGETCMSHFREPQYKGGGHWVFEFKNFSEANLPKGSVGPLAGYTYGRPDFCPLYHGIKIEGLYSFLADLGKPDGGLKESGDKSSAGHRFNEQNWISIIGVYGLGEPHKEGIRDYACWCPLFCDGTYVRCWIEMYVDRTWSVPYKHHDQKVQMSNHKCKKPSGEPVFDTEDYVGGPSIWYKAVHFEHLGYQHLPHEAEVSLVWNPSLEMRPDWVNKAYGENRERMCIVQYPKFSDHIRPIVPPSMADPSQEAVQSPEEWLRKSLGLTRESGDPVARPLQDVP